MSRYDELERLQRLRESGALTDDEFQAEKRRLLGHKEVAAEEEAVQVDSTVPSRRRIWIVLGLAGLAVAIVAGLLLGRMSGGGDDGIIDLPMPTENEAVDSNLVEAKVLPDVRTLPADEQLARAFGAAFAQGAKTSGADGGSLTYRPGILRWAGSRAILVSPGVSESGCHACRGALAVHYLEPEGDKLRVTGRWETAIDAGAYGKPPDWSLSTLLSAQPMLRTRLHDGNQGYFCTQEAFYEFGPEGPRKIADIPIGYDDVGALGKAAGKTIDGKIINAMRDQSFDVLYSGSRMFSEHYVRGAAGYAVAGGKSTMALCR
jgi:Short C-terminal domain